MSGSGGPGGRVEPGKAEAGAPAPAPAPGIDALRDACARAPDEARAWFNFADALERTGRPADAAEAVHAYRRAVEADRELAVSHDRLGRLLLRTGQAAAAAAVFEELSHLQPRFPGLQLVWGHALAAAHDWEGAVARYMTCAKIDPEREVPALTAWARLLRERGDVAGARGLLAQALHEDPYYYLAHAEDGRCLIASGERVKGATRLARALEVISYSGEGPDLETERAAIERDLRAALGE